MGYSYSYGRRGLYRSRDGILFGVCKGIADYFDISVFWTRVITLAAFIFTGFCPVGIAYILAVFLMKPEPRYLDY
jgi:phage shock protein C